MSLIAARSPPGARRGSPAARACRTRRGTPARTPREPVGVDRGEEADLAEVDREDRHARARVARSAPGSSRRRRGRRTGRRRGAARRPSTPGRRLEPVLLGLLGVEAQRRRPRARGGRDQRARARRRVSVGAPVGEDDGALTAPPPRAAASRSSTAPPRPPSASQTNVSRLPFGPGQPRRGEAQHGRAQLRARGDGHADERLAPQRGVAHHAALADPLAARPRTAA